ncbi:MAG: hypothetical protein M3Y04_02505 [Actinomycetota bacterium]|nr:hypothetical protein [Actinomycetota bacterium]
MIIGNPHVSECRRGRWLLEQLAARPRREVFLDALLLRGPACTCPLTQGATVQV